MTDFIGMVDKIAADLRRSNIDDSIKTAINDAIREAAVTRFWFNEYRTSFDTGVGQFTYDELGFVEIDAMWDTTGQRFALIEMNAKDQNDLLEGNVQNGRPDSFARYGGYIRLYPTPLDVRTIYVEGYGRLLPSPLDADDDTNAWLNEGELYIRALAKRNVLRDVVRDYGEARMMEATAEDYKQQLVDQTNLKIGTNTLRATRF